MIKYNDIFLVKNMYYFIHNIFMRLLMILIFKNCNTIKIVGDRQDKTTNSKVVVQLNLFVLLLWLKKYRFIPTAQP